MPHPFFYHPPARANGKMHTLQTTTWVSVIKLFLLISSLPSVLREHMTWHRPSVCSRPFHFEVRQSAETRLYCLVYTSLISLQVCASSSGNFKSSISDCKCLLGVIYLCSHLSGSLVWQLKADANMWMQMLAFKKNKQVKSRNISGCVDLRTKENGTWKRNHRSGNLC